MFLEFVHSSGQAQHSLVSWLLGGVELLLVIALQVSDGL